MGGCFTHKRRENKQDHAQVFFSFDLPVSLNKTFLIYLLGFEFTTCIYHIIYQYTN